MSEADELLKKELLTLPAKPGENSSQADKKRYSELMSAAAARALGEALRRKGLKGTLPTLHSTPSVDDGSQSKDSLDGDSEEN